MSPAARASEVAFLDALADARALTEADVPLEAALADVPAERRPDLTEALHALARLATIEEPPASAFVEALEVRLLQTLDEARATRGRPRGFLDVPLLWRVGAAAAAVLLVFAVSGFAVVQASERTIPGDALYPVKEVREAVAVRIAPNDGRLVRAHLERLAARQRELEVALARNAAADVILTLERGVANAVNQSVQVSLRLKAAGKPAPAALALDAIAALHARIDQLATVEDGRATALSLRRISTFLADQERVLRGELPAPPRPLLRPTEVHPLDDATTVPPRARPAATTTPAPLRPR